MIGKCGQCKFSGNYSAENELTFGTYAGTFLLPTTFLNPIFPKRTRSLTSIPISEYLFISYNLLLYSGWGNRLFQNCCKRAWQIRHQEHLTKSKPVCYFFFESDPGRKKKSETDLKNNLCQLLQLKMSCQPETKNWVRFILARRLEKTGFSAKNKNSIKIRVPNKNVELLQKKPQIKRLGHFE